MKRNITKHQVVELFDQGLWIDEIADELEIGTELVKMYLSIERRSFRPIPVNQKWRDMFSFKWNTACERIRRYGR